MIYLTEAEAKIYEKYKELRGVVKVAQAMNRSHRTIGDTCRRLKEKGMFRQPNNAGPYIPTDEPYEIGKKAKEEKTVKKKRSPLEVPPITLKFVTGTSGPCIVTHISDYPEEEQRRMMGLFRQVPVKGPITTISQDIAKQKRRRA